LHLHWPESHCAATVLRCIRRREVGNAAFYPDLFPAVDPRPPCASVMQGLLRHARRGTS
jgi:hypothetical protein